MSSSRTTERSDSWTFLSNHAHVLICLARDPDMRLRDVAAEVGMTERGVIKIVRELEESGVITRVREGRRNHYHIDPTVRLRHPLESHCTVASLIEMVLGTGDEPARKPGGRRATGRR